MKLFRSFIIILIIFSLGCSNHVIECTEAECIEIECVEDILEQNDMVAYQGQEIGCKFFLELYYYQNKQYFLLGNHCADLISYPRDCEGNTLCENGYDSKCRKFYEQAKRIGIVGISE